MEDYEILNSFPETAWLRGQEKTQCILLPAKVKSSRYCMRTKSCKYFEMGHCRFGKKCRFIHNPRGPTTFEYAKLSKEMVHAFDQKFKELHTNFKCMLDKQTEEIIHLKKLLIETLDTIAGKTAENFPLQQESLSPSNRMGGNYRREIRLQIFLNAKIKIHRPFLLLRTKMPQQTMKKHQQQPEV